MSSLSFENIPAPRGVCVAEAYVSSWGFPALTASLGSHEGSSSETWPLSYQGPVVTHIQLQAKITVSRVTQVWGSSGDDGWDLCADLALPN